MVTNVMSRYRGYFPMIFRKAHEFIEILFGISLREVDPDGSNIFGNALELSCEGSLSDEQGMPPNRLLILILKYREVPNTAPPRYEFLWGPRAHSEISKRKVVEFLAMLKNTVPVSFPPSYKDALKDVEERAQAIIDTSPCAVSPSFSSE
uniref:MAGE domain-containing protein n=1 Tax=Colobus angolensis palliatus TaxID=336983 RepID=A0A2K5HS03_COLAP